MKGDRRNALAARRERRAKYGCVGAICQPGRCAATSRRDYHQNPRQRRRARTVSRGLHTRGNRSSGSREYADERRPPPAVDAVRHAHGALRRLRARRPNAGREARPAYANVLSAAVTGPQLPEASTADIRAGRSRVLPRRRPAPRSRGSCSASPSRSRARTSRCSSATTSSTACRTIFPIAARRGGELGLRRCGRTRRARRRGRRRRRRDSTGPSRRWSTSRAIRAGAGSSKARARTRSSARVMAAARVRGFQGDGLSRAATATRWRTAKHFVAYGAAEGGRDYNVADISRAHAARDLPAAVRGRGCVPAPARSWPRSTRSPACPCTRTAGCSRRAARRVGLRRPRRQRLDGRHELLNHGVAADSARGRAPRARCRRRHGHGERRLSSSSCPRVRAGRVPDRRARQAVRRVLRAKYERSACSRIRTATATRRESARSRGAGNRRRGARHRARARSCCSRTTAACFPLRKDLRSARRDRPARRRRDVGARRWAGAGRPEDAVTLLAGIRQRRRC